MTAVIVPDITAPIVTPEGKATPAYHAFLVAVAMKLANLEQRVVDLEP